MAKGMATMATLKSVGRKGSETKYRLFGPFPSSISKTGGFVADPLT